MPRLLLRGIPLIPLIAGLLAVATAVAGETVVLRTGDGEFLRVDSQGVLLPGGLLPEPEVTFDIETSEEGGLTLRAADGRRLEFAPSSPMLVRAEEAGDNARPTCLRLVPSAGGGFVFGTSGPPRLREEDRSTFSASRLSAKRVFRPKNGPVPSQPVNGCNGEPEPEPQAAIYHTGDMPVEMRTALTEVLTGLASAELSDRPYDKTKVRPKRKYVKLPAPTLKDPGRTRRHKVLAYTEEQRVRAALDGPLELAIHRMPYLKRYGDPASKLLLFSVEATVPVRGLVQYKIRDRLSATAKYRAVVHLRAVGELGVRKTGGSVAFDVPRLRELRVDLKSLDLSNDVLAAMRGTIRRVLNDELADRRAVITEKANKALAKAVKTREFSHPALKLLLLP